MSRMFVTLAAQRQDIYSAPMPPEASSRVIDPFEGYTSAFNIYEGAETVVYRARSSAGAPVILKVTKNEFPTQRELARLRREFTILRELDLPFTPKAHALEEHGRGLALVMADIGHATLRELLDSRKLDIEAVLTIAISLCDVLSAVHLRRVIHKDVTPRNIIVNEAQREVYLLDFGIAARLSQEMHGPGSMNALEGTLLYIAPEQTGKMNRAVDLRADLYSLGAVLYEMLTGSVPFSADDPMELIHLHLARKATPPHEREPGVPRPLSDIVMGLLAKTPEERYQSDAGLKADLVECLRQWKVGKSIAPFILRRHDKATELRRPQKLYGREQDIKALLEAFERVRLRGPELLTVTGHSGIGKSALVNEIRKLTGHQGGYFVSGKFDQISRDVPLAPVVQAFRELIRQILTESQQSLARWKANLLAALGENGRLLTDLVPELLLIIGPQPSVPALSPDQARNRFELVLQNFLNPFATSEHPLVIFLDDLQWADPASLRFIKLLLVDAYSEHILLIGAYRDNEVTPGHPVSTMLGELGSAGLRVTDIHLRPLSRQEVATLVADTLTSRIEEVSALSDLVFEKTQGNPFFAYQFMATLSERDLLRFDAPAGEWRWDIDRIKGANVTDNVVDLMVSKLKKLEPASQQVIMLAACIGHHFDLRSLSTIAQRSISETAAALLSPMREGLVMPLDADYRLLEGMADGAEAATLDADFDIHYRFVHDRILQAAYSLAPAEQKQELHLSIGRLLRHRSGAQPRDEDLLDIVRHLNLGASGIKGAAERLDLACLDARAGKRAKAATAYRAAADYLRAGIELLVEADWESDYDLCFALHVDGAECEYLAGDVDRAKALFSAVLPRTRTDVERASIYVLRLRVLFSLGQFAEALKIGGEGLVLLGYPWAPEDMDSQEVLMAELAAVETNLGGRRIEDLINTPEVSEPNVRAMLELFDTMGLSAYQRGSNAFGVVVLKAVNLSLKHGFTEVCAFSYMSLAYTLGPILGRVSECLAFGKLALDLLKRFPNAMQTARVYVCYISCVNLVSTLREVEPYVNTTRDKGLESGELGMAGVACFVAPMVKLGAGDQLEDVLENADRHLAIVRRTREFLWIATTTVVRQVVANLLGKTRSRTTLSDESFNEEEFVGRLNDVEHGNTTFHYWAFKVQLHHLYGEYAEAMAAAEKAEPRAMYAGGNPQAKLLSFHLCMAILAAPPAPTPEEAARRAEMLARNKAQLDALSVSSPRGFQHLKVLVEAEAARMAGELEQAVRLYEQAIQLSQDLKAPHIEAMACELAARLYMRIGARKAAGAYLRDAYRAYLHWGAMAKAEALAAEIGELLPALHDDSARTRTTTTRSVTDVAVTSSAILSRTTLGNLRDAGLVLKASQAIATEIDLTKVIARLVGLVLENAGAQRGALILSRKGALVVSAAFGEGSTSIDEGQGKPLEDANDLAQSVVLYVARTQEAVVLDEPGAVTRFLDDPYLRAATPKSVLGLPLLYQARLVGVLYLENRATAGVFNAARVELLALLSSQAAISIENASLYASLLAENAERRRAEQEVRKLNSELEMRVEERTRQLKEANQELEAFSYSVSHDLRSPLRTIDGFSLALLEDHGDRLEGEARDALGRVRKASLRMQELIDDLLALSRVARSEMVREPVDLSALAREVAAEIQNASPGREVTWVIAEGVTAPCDPKMLKIALENLLGNAFKFTKKRPHARIEFGARVEPDGRRAYFVRDDGAGFDMTYMSKLFGAFQRLHKVDEFEGTGIGLATVRRIIGRHGGQIWAEGAVEKGAMFSFTL